MIPVRISVAVAVYNGATFLQNLLTSLEEQQLKPFEIIVVDDSSTDASAEIINSFPFSFSQLKYYKNESNLGVLETFKKAVALCTGDYIALCDQDDIWFPQKLQNTFELLNKGETPSIVFTDLIVIDNAAKIIVPSFWKYYNIKPEALYFFDLLFANVVTGCTVLMNTKMRNHIADMPTDVMMHDHWLALIAYSFGSYTFSENPMVYYREHNESVTAKQKQSLIKRMRLAYKERSLFLKTNLIQAKQFKNIYKSLLSEKNIMELEYFIALESKTFFFKRLIALLRVTPFRFVIDAHIYKNRTRND